MSRIVHITTKAADDIDSNMMWWAENRSSKQSLRWYADIRKHIDSLAEAPENNPPAFENDDSSFVLHEAYFGLSHRKTHRIIFRILPDKVEVLAIRHLAQNSLADEDLK